MDTISLIFFYILSIFCLAAATFCLFQKKITNAVISAAVLFFLSAGFYFLLYAPFLGILQLLFAGALSAALFLCAMKVYRKKDEKFAFQLNLKTILVPFISVIFIFLVAPFMLFEFGNFKTVESHAFKHFAGHLFHSGPAAFLLIIILALAAATGILSIILTKKNKGVK